MAQCPQCGKKVPETIHYCPFCGRLDRQTAGEEPSSTQNPPAEVWILSYDPTRKRELVEYLTRVSKGKDRRQVEARLDHVPVLLFGSVSFNNAEILRNKLHDLGAKVEIRSRDTLTERSEEKAIRRGVSSPVLKAPAGDRPSRAGIWVLIIGGVVFGLTILFLLFRHHDRPSPNLVDEEVETTSSLLVPTVMPPSQPTDTFSTPVVVRDSSPRLAPTLEFSLSQEKRDHKNGRKNLRAEAEERYRNNDLEKAVGLYRQYLAENRDDLSARRRLAFIENELGTTGELKRRDNFYVNLLYQGAIPDGVEDMVSDALYEAYREVGIEFDFFPSDRLTVILYRQDVFQMIGFAPIWAEGVYDGKIRIPISRGGEETVPLLRKIVFHEYAHAVVHRLSAGKCPVWFNEGLALWAQEGGGNPFPSGVPRWRYIPLSRLETSFIGLLPEEIPSAYLISFTAIDTLMSRTSFSYLVSFLKKLAAGEKVHQAFRDSFFFPLADFEEMVAESLEEMSG